MPNDIATNSPINGLACPAVVEAIVFGHQSRSLSILVSHTFSQVNQMLVCITQLHIITTEMTADTIADMRSLPTRAACVGMSRMVVIGAKNS